MSNSDSKIAEIESATRAYVNVLNLLLTLDPDLVSSVGKSMWAFIQMRLNILLETLSIMAKKDDNVRKYLEEINKEPSLLKNIKW